MYIFYAYFKGSVSHRFVWQRSSSERRNGFNLCFTIIKKNFNFFQRTINFHATAETKQSKWRSPKSHALKSLPDLVISGGICFGFDGTIHPGVTTVWTVWRSRWSIALRFSWLGWSTTMSSWWRLTAATSRSPGSGTGRRGSIENRYLLLWSSNASEGGRETWAKMLFHLTPRPPPETPGSTAHCNMRVSRSYQYYWRGSDTAYKELDSF